MKVLLDECLPVDFRHELVPHDVHTAEWAGLKGKKNGELLRAAEVAGYDVLLTVDQGIPYQQNPDGRRVSIIVMPTPTNKLEDLKLFTEALLLTLNNIGVGQFVVLPRRGPTE
jgi:hypothetical protein